MKQKGIAKDMTKIDNSKSKWKGTWKSFIPTVIIIALLLFFFHSQIFGFFTQFDTDPTHFEKSIIYTFPNKAVIGTPWKYNFSKELIPLLESMSITNSTSKLKNNTNSSSGSTSSTNYASYTFYLGSGAGSIPTGLTLSNDGILKGTPTGNGGIFEICIRDNGEVFTCRTYQLNIEPKDNNPPDIINPKPNLPPCSTELRCGKMTVVGGYYGGGPVWDYCQCPNDRVDGGIVKIPEPNKVWEKGNNPGEYASKTDSEGVWYWLLEDGKYHSQKYCICRDM